MQKAANTVVRSPEGDSRAYSLKVGLHKGSVLSALLFVIVMEVITNELQLGFPCELLYADDFMLMPESEVELCEKIVNLKAGVEAKGFKMNIRKMKVMFACAFS